MKRYLIVNPNSSRTMTDEIAESVRACALEYAQADVVCMPDSPAVLETYADYLRAGANMLRFFEGAGRRAAGYDGVLVACYGDPGLYALKETLEVPVVGIAEASMSVSVLLGGKFSIVAAVPKAKAMMERMVQEYGFEKRLASVEALNLDIQSFMAQPERLHEVFAACVERAVGHGADTVIYGCAGMTLLQRMEGGYAAGIVDPVRAGVFQLRALAEGGFGIAPNGLFAS